MAHEDTTSTVIVCHESGDQFVPKNFVVVYTIDDGIEGIWKVTGNGYVRLKMVCKVLEGAHTMLAQTLDDLLNIKKEKEGEQL